jgi:formylglycine-generating enzyme required for sulfatase activity
MDSFLMQAMRLNRDSRFASAKAMRRALVKASSPTPVPPPSPVDVFEFETVTLNAKGKITNRRTVQARQVIEDLGGGVRIEMVEIPGGEFMMGSPESEADHYSDEGPQHQVSVSSFYMGRYQVTQAQWRAVAALSKVKIDLNPDPSHFKGDNLPVECVSWEEAMEFCERLSKASGKTYRLPTEAEWEYACRAGTTSAFAFGETITPEIVNYDGNYPYASAPKGEYRQKTTPVGSMGVANGFGLCDMHGNVWEWCMDNWHGNYDGAPTDGSEWKGGDSSYRVLRGGSWNNYGRNCRAAFRYNIRPGDRYNDVGFRVVVVVWTR